jgi:chromosomal replication initiation ATPase DnaA
MNTKKINDIIYSHLGFNINPQLARKVRNIITDYHFFAFEPTEVSQQREVKKVTPENILNAIDKVLDVNLDQIKSQTRKSRIVLARQFFCYLVRERCNYGLVDVGAMINRDHSTVLHSVNVIATMLDNNKFYQFYFNEVLKNI